MPAWRCLNPDCHRRCGHGVGGTGTHAIRRGKKCLGCSVAIDGRPDYCPTCRVESRRRLWRESNARIAEKRETAA